MDSCKALGRRIFARLGIAFLVVVTWNTLVSSLVAYRLGRLSMVLFLPLWIPMLLIPLGVGLMALVMGVALSQELGKGGKPEGDLGDGAT